MTVFNKFTVAGLGIAAFAAPAQALLPTRVISASTTVASSTDPSRPEITNWSNSYTDPNPTSAEKFVKGNNFYETMNYATNCGTDCVPTSGTAATTYLVELAPGVTKAYVKSTIAMDKPYLDTNKTIADMAIDALSVDRITFTGLTPGANAVVKISNYASVKFAQQTYQNYGGSIMNSSSSFYYSSESVFL